MPHHNADTPTAVYCPTPLPANAPPQITIHYVHSVVGVVGVVLHTYCAAAGEATCRSLAHSTNTVLSISPLRQVRNSVYKLGVYGWHGASWHRHGVVGALFTCISSSLDPLHPISLIPNTRTLHLQSCFVRQHYQRAATPFRRVSATC